MDWTQSAAIKCGSRWWHTLRESRMGLMSVCSQSLTFVSLKLKSEEWVSPSTTLCKVCCQTFNGLDVIRHFASFSIYLYGGRINIMNTFILVPPPLSLTDSWGFTSFVMVQPRCTSLLDGSTISDNLGRGRSASPVGDCHRWIVGTQKSSILMGQKCAFTGFGL